MRAGTDRPPLLGSNKGPCFEVGRQLAKVIQPVVLNPSRSASSEALAGVEKLITVETMPPPSLAG